jgi:hypothetical protein
MLTRLKLTIGEGQLVEPSSYLTRRKQFHSPQVAEKHSPSMAHAEDNVFQLKRKISGRLSYS